MTYDGAGNPSSTTASGGAKAQVAFNPDGTLKSSTDPAGNTTTYTNDPKSKYVTKITPPSTAAIGPTTITGVPATSITNGAGQTTNYTYDELDRVTKSSSTDVTVNYTHSTAGRLTTRADNTQKTTYAYDARGNLTSIATTPVAAGAPPASTVSYGYDKAGNMTSRSIGSDTTRYAYDAANRLVTMTDGEGNVTRFAYDNNNRRTDTWWITNADNSSYLARTHNEFDKAGRLVRTWTTSQKSGSQHIVDSSYSYLKDGVDTGLIQSITDNTNKTSANLSVLSYDTQNRLTSATNWNGKNYSYKYDRMGNRTQVTTNGQVTQSLTFNADNEITTPGYAYDKAGRRTQDKTGNSLISYNSEGQAISQYTGGLINKMLYAGQGQDELVSQDDGKTKTQYVYGRADQAGVPQLEATDQLITDNDANGQPISVRQRGGNSLFLTYYIYDGLGRMVGRVAGGGSSSGVGTLDAPKWDPYGAVETAASSAPSKTGPNEIFSKSAAASASAGSASPWTTIGVQSQSYYQYWKRGTRWNDTATGTWTTVDPITMLNNPNRANPYTYVGDDPINNIDPAGRFDLDWGGVGAAVGGILGGAAGGALCGPGCAVAGGALGAAAGGGVGNLYGEGEQATGDQVGNWAIGGAIGGIPSFTAFSRYF